MTFRVDWAKNQTKPKLKTNHLYPQHTLTVPLNKHIPQLTHNPHHTHTHTLDNSWYISMNTVLQIELYFMGVCVSTDCVCVCVFVWHWLLLLSFSAWLCSVVVVNFFDLDTCDHVHVFNLCHIYRCITLFVKRIKPSITGVSCFRRAIITSSVIISIKTTPPCCYTWVIVVFDKIKPSK